MYSIHAPVITVHGMWLATILVPSHQLQQCRFSALFHPSERGSSGDRPRSSWWRRLVVIVGACWSPELSFGVIDAEIFNFMIFPEPHLLSRGLPDITRVALIGMLKFLEGIGNSLYQQWLNVFCFVLFSIYTDIDIDIVIDSSFHIVILVKWLYHDVFLYLNPSGQ